MTRQECAYSGSSFLCSKGFTGKNRQARTSFLRELAGFKVRRIWPPFSEAIRLNLLARPDGQRRIN
jgi:hypothetical protein